MKSSSLGVLKSWTRVDQDREEIRAERNADRQEEEGLGGGTISPSYSTCMGLRVLGWQKYTRQNH